MNMMAFFQNCTLGAKGMTNEVSEGSGAEWSFWLSNNKCSTFHYVNCTLSQPPDENDVHNKILTMLENQLASNNHDQFIDLSYF